VESPRVCSKKRKSPSPPFRYSLLGPKCLIRCSLFAYSGDWLGSSIINKAKKTENKACLTSVLSTDCCGGFTNDAVTLPCCSVASRGGEHPKIIQEHHFIRNLYGKFSKSACRSQSMPCKSCTASYHNTSQHIPHYPHSQELFQCLFSFASPSPHSSSPNHTRLFAYVLLGVLFWIRFCFAGFVLVFCFSNFLFF